MSHQVLKAIKEEVSAGRATCHENGPYKLFKYSRDTFIDGFWNETNRKLRGIVFRDGKIVGRGFDKFFNIGEHVETDPKRIERMMKMQHYTITNKMDGSLILLWNDEGRWHTSTTGHLSSSQAGLAMEILAKKDLSDWPTDITYCFELLSRRDRHVIDYGAEDHLMFLAAFENKWELKEVSVCRLFYFLDKQGIKIVQPYHCDNVFDTIPDGVEGFVLSFDDGFRVKFKSRWYFKIHRLLDYMSPGRILEIIKDGSFKEVYTFLPEHIQIEAERIKEDIMRVKREVESEVNTIWATVENPDNFKECAALFNSMTQGQVKSILFCRMRKQDESYALFQEIGRRIEK